MTDLNEMWQELERYQPYADKRGFGAEWLRMTTERTDRAAMAARDVAGTAWDAVGYYVARAAACAAAACAAESADRWSQHAINDIRDAIELEEKT